MRHVNGLTLSLAAVFIFVVPDCAWAYKLNPCLRVLTYEKYLLGQEPIRMRNLCGRAPEQYRNGAVHEHMTNFAIDEYRGEGFLTNERKRPGKEQKRNYMTEPEWSKAPHSVKHKHYALIYGTWWNDDPLMYTWGSLWDFNHGLGLLKRQFANVDGYYEGGVRSCKVASDDFLGRASHYGRMQYLHFMTDRKIKDSVNESDRLDDTISQSLTWIAFAYQVAIGERKPDAALTVRDEETLGLPSIAKNYCLQDPGNAKVRTLFARAGLPIDVRNAITPDVALGSIFHLVQDSFSPGHTCRVEMKVNGQSVAALSRVYNYTEQDPGKHGMHDGYPGWLLTYAIGGEHVYANDPIAVSTWLLEAVDSQKPWDEVRTHLLNTVFVKQPANAPEQQCIGNHGLVTGMR